MSKELLIFHFPFLEINIFWKFRNTTMSEDTKSLLRICFETLPRVSLVPGGQITVSKRRGFLQEA